MSSLDNHMEEYQAQLRKGNIQRAYQGLMKYFRDLRSWCCQKYPDWSIPSNIYFGNMDITFFAFSPPSLKSRKLKLLFVFSHETFRFELWLAGVNKGFQSKYLKLLKENNWSKYTLASSGKGVDYISKCILVEDPRFDDLDALTREIDKGAQAFIAEIEGFLVKHD